MDAKQINRWNIILGEEEQKNGECRGLSAVLNYVYGADAAARGDRLKGGNGKSVLSVPQWIASAKTLLPKKGFDAIARHAVRKYNLHFLLAEDAVLDAVEPDVDMLRQILAFKSVLDKSKQEKIRALVRRIADELSAKMKTEVSLALYGSKKSFSRGYVRKLKNLDFKATIKKNLKTYDAPTGKLIVQSMVFRSNTDRRLTKKLILLADESGSMVDSVINTAVLSGILCNTGFLDVHVAAFDTSVVDLTPKCSDVADMMMSVQLGGGTDVGKALRYGFQQLEEPRKSIVVLISDLCDGCGYREMYSAAAAILSAGAKLLCLTAMDYNTGAAYDEKAAKKLADMGASVGAMTPGELCDWIVKETN